MKTHSLVVMALILGFAGVLLITVRANGPPSSAANSQQADGAFRDGLYQAQLDVGTGREPHIAIGRWNTEADRALFIAGYQQGYREFSEARAVRLVKPAAASPTGHRAE